MSDTGKTTIGALLETVINEASQEKSKIKLLFQQIASHPIKLIMSFIAAPFLIARLALTIKNPIRRLISVVGLLLSVFCAYIAGTVLGTATGALFIMSNIGFFVGIGFFLGSFISLFLSVAFSILVLNSVSFIFLKMSSQEVVDYLEKISSE